MPDKPLPAKDIILQVAERLFAEHGYAGVSLRQITVAAKVNLAAVNYHYYDKESLYGEIITRRLREVNRRRLALLEALEKHGADAPSSVGAIVRAMAQPLFDPSDDPQGYNLASMRLLGRLLTEPTPRQQLLLREEFEPVMLRFGQAIRRHLPGLPAAEFLWRFSFVVGALHHSLATLHHMRDLTRGICADHDTDSALASYLRFAENALKQASVPPNELRAD